MIQTRGGQLIALVVILLIVGLAGGVVQAQEGNLLGNPGFEGHYPFYQGILEFRLADGWEVWYRHRAEGEPENFYRRPEYRPGTYSFNGTMAQQFFTSYSTHEAGFFQRVPDRLIPGEVYRFSIAGYIWSSVGGDFYRSENPGEAKIRIGIDPTGNTNPWSRNIVWSPLYSFYDEWQVLSVEAEAQATSATVFVWSQQAYPVMHNDTAWDDAYFGLASSAPALETIDATLAEEGMVVEVTDEVAEGVAEDVIEETVTEPEPVAPVTVSPYPLSGITVTADIDLRMRVRKHGEVLDVIPAGTVIEVYGRSPDQDWTYVEYNGQQGWIASWYGQYSAPFDALPEIPMS